MLTPCSSQTIVTTVCSVCVFTYMFISSAAQHYAINQAYQVTEWPIDIDPLVLLSVAKGQRELYGRSLM